MLRTVTAGLLGGIAAWAASTTTPAVTFDKDVLPILQKQCQSCHRPGEVAPMSFLSYQETRPWAKAIKSAVLTKKMPPWFADPAYGHFSNARILSDAERNTLVAWADSGAPEGDALNDALGASVVADSARLKTILGWEGPKRKSLLQGIGVYAKAWQAGFEAHQK